jgi:hypothetical protein
MAASAVQHEESARQQLLGYVRVVAPAMFALPAVGDERARYVELAVGEILPLLAPNEWERSRLRDFVKKEAFRPTPHVVVEWGGQRRFMPLENVLGEDERARRVLESLTREWAESEEERRS